MLQPHPLNATSHCLLCLLSWRSQRNTSHYVSTSWVSSRDWWGFAVTVDESGMQSTLLHIQCYLPQSDVSPNVDSLIVTYTHLFFLVLTHISHLASSAQIQLKNLHLGCVGILPVRFSVYTSLCRFSHDLCLHSNVLTHFSTWYKSIPHTTNLRQWMRPDIPRFGRGSTSNRNSVSSPS